MLHLYLFLLTVFCTGVLARSPSTLDTRQCVFCPEVIPVCQCPPNLQCVIVARSCTACASAECVSASGSVVVSRSEILPSFSLSILRPPPVSHSTPVPSTSSASSVATSQASSTAPVSSPLPSSSTSSPFSSAPTSASVSSPLLPSASSSAPTAAPSSTGTGAGVRIAGVWPAGFIPALLGLLAMSF
ncbi:unnamed protein product [Mycena citricolor]|uniref:Membrane anchor Opy2 N-terminal domain-containing protein n=1 Tax=Mycena citricolor TaxID=2018698 RepID=A0AAD2HS71_9AGAR|nr:unnamed protein product [Mycena citricolor]